MMIFDGTKFELGLKRRYLDRSLNILRRGPDMSSLLPCVAFSELASYDIRGSALVPAFLFFVFCLLSLTLHAEFYRVSL
jgi:hypothetical protein